jgi:hypothetical protein
LKLKKKNCEALTDVKRIGILGRDQKQIPFPVIEPVIVEILYPCTFHNVDQQEKIMLISPLGKNGQLSEFKFKRLV